MFYRIDQSKYNQYIHEFIPLKCFTLRSADNKCLFRMNFSNNNNGVEALHSK